MTKVGNSVREFEKVTWEEKFASAFNLPWRSKTDSLSFGSIEDKIVVSGKEFWEEFWEQRVMEQEGQYHQHNIRSQRNDGQHDDQYRE